MPTGTQMSNIGKRSQANKLKTAARDQHHLEVETKRVYHNDARKRRYRNNDDDNIDLPSRMAFAHLLGHISDNAVVVEACFRLRRVDTRRLFQHILI